jgi:hypothetical protein
MMQATFWLTIGAAAAIGLLAGASLDQSIKQLPARRRLGVVAYSEYSQASDLGNGVVFYATLGVGAALLTIAAAVAAQVAGLPGRACLPADLGAALAVLHSLATARAAPTNFSQRRARGDPAALWRVFDRFARWQAVRAGLQVATFGVLLWAVVEFVRLDSPPNIEGAD